MDDVLNNNKELACKFFDSLSSGTQDYLDFYTDDSIIWTAGDNAIGGTRTKEEIVEFAQGILAAFPNGITFNITGMTAEADRVAVEVSSESIHASGQSYNNKYHFLLIIRDGKIIQLKEYMDTQLAAKILLNE